jgi:hypothetical protein
LPRVLRLAEIGYFCAYLSDFPALGKKPARRFALLDFARICEKRRPLSEPPDLFEVL